MPGQGGLNLQRELTQAGTQIPIIFVTGHGSIPMTVRASWSRWADSAASHRERTEQDLSRRTTRSPTRASG